MFCPYFRQVLRSREELDVYFNALLRELSLYGKILEDMSLQVTEIHVGGGTPSLVPPIYYRKLLEKLSEFFDVKCNIGIEVNPEDFRDYRLAEEFYANSVDEVSIGVQSFDKRVLKALSRKHTPEDNVLAIENSVKAGFKWINVDLMFLAPNIKGYMELNLKEKLGIFKRDLERSLELGVHQITYYATVIPTYSSGYKLVNLGRLYQEIEAIDYFVEEALRFCEDKKLHLVRVYSLSKKLYEYATVNLEMIGPLIGLGAGAWSNTGYYGHINVHDVAKYIESLAKNKLPAIYARRFNKSTRAWRLFIDQLSSGVVQEAMFKSLGLEIPLAIKILLKLMEFSKLIKRTEEDYKLTKHGIVEVYKAIMNFIIEVPVKVTGILLNLKDLDKLPHEITIR